MEHQTNENNKGEEEHQIKGDFLEPISDERNKKESRNSEIGDEDTESGNDIEIEDAIRIYERNLKEDDPDLFEGVPENKKEEILRATFGEIVYTQMEIEQRWSGPLPPPAVLGQYDSVYPGLSKEIVEMAKAQQQHRMDLEKEVIPNREFLSRRGQVFGFIIALIGMLGGFTLGALGHEFVGSVLGGGSLIALVSLFIRGKKSQENDLKSKDPNK